MTLSQAPGGTPYGDGDVFELEALAGAWTEGMVSGDTVPDTIGDTLLVDSATAPTINVTTIVQQWFDGLPNNGLQIQNMGFNDFGEFASKENGGAQGPMLEIDFTAIPEPAALSGLFGLAALLARRRLA